MAYKAKCIYSLALYQKHTLTLELRITEFWQYIFKYENYISNVKMKSV